MNRGIFFDATLFLFVLQISPIFAIPVNIMLPLDTIAQSGLVDPTKLENELKVKFGVVLILM
jgi:hypothetical protein